MITSLLRTPDVVVSACGDQDAQPRVARDAMLLIVVGCVALGATVGSYRGGMQIPAAGLKLTLATFGTLAACAPAFAAISAAFDRPWGLRRTLAVVLSAGARAALVWAALAPVLWLLIDLGLPYSATKLVATGAFALGGVSALALLFRALGPGSGRIGAALSIMAVYAVVGAQTAWLLRPYIGDPREAHVPWLVSERREGGVGQAIWDALDR